MREWHRKGYNYRMNRMDHLIIQLMRLDDDEYVTSVLQQHRVMDYDPLPDKVSELVADILYERLADKFPGELTKEEKRDEWDD